MCISGNKTLFFKHGYGKIDVVCENIDFHSCHEKILEFCNNLNPNFKIYYTRVYEVDNVVHFDVGSHSEFFYWTDRDLIKEWSEK